LRKNLVSQLVEQIAQQQHVQLKVSYRIDSLQTMKSLVQQGLAQAILPWSTITAEIASGHLVARLIVDPPLIRTLNILRPMGAPAATVSNAVLSSLRNIIRGYEPPATEAPQTRN
jgi:LysR family nitrogen assimilation transcriptional regulator